MKNLYLLLFFAVTSLANAQNINWIKKGVGPYGLNKLESVTYANPDKLWAVGNNGYVISSSDNGFTWEENSTGSSDDLVDIAISATTQNDPSNGYAVSKQGTAFHNHKSLESWDNVSINAGEYEEPVAFHGIEYIGQNPTLGDVHMMAIGEGASKGLLLTDNGQVNCTNCSQELTVVRELNDIPRDIFFLDYYDYNLGSLLRRIYIVGDNGFAAYSEDNFETYTLLPNLVATENLTSVSFKDVNTGYIGAEGALYYTNNGGATWTKQDTSPWNAVKITDIRYINSLAYATAVSLTDPSATFYAEMIPTSSSFSFSINYINEGGLNQLTERYMGIYPSVDGQNFVLISENGTIAESSDYGSTFTVQNTDIPSPNAMDVTGSRIYVSYGFASTNSAFSEDNGDTWVPISFSGALTDYSIDEIAVKYNGTDYAGLAATALEPTYFFEDGEINSWLPGVEYNYQADGVIQDIDFDSDGNAWFVGNSSIYKASGANYAGHERIPTGAGYQLGYNVDEYAVDFLDSQTGYIVGPSGFIYKTINGGTNWSTLDASTSVDLREVAFLNSDDGFVLFDASTDEYLYTEDGGDTWEFRSLPAVTVWNEILFSSESVGYIAGEDGFLATTTDAGASWSLINLGIDQHIVDISFNDEKLYGVIDGGFIFSIAEKQSQTITFDPITDKTLGEEPFELTAYSSSTLEVSYTSSDEEVITINANTATIVGSGTATITASQGGNEYYNPAEDQQQTFTVETAALGFSEDYPQFEYYLSDTYRILLKLTEEGSVYYIVEPDGSTPPTAEQIEAGKNASGANAYKKGVAWSLEAGTEYNQAHISGLEEGTAYDIYLALADENYVLQPIVTKLDVSTSDNTAPQWSEGYPQMGAISSLEADVAVDLDEETGMIYYAVFRSSSTTRFPANLKNGSNYQALDEGALSASTAEFTLTNLSEGSDYDVWLVAEDASENLQSTATKIDFTTIDDIDPVFDEGYPVLTSINETAIEIQARFDEQVTVYAVAQISGNSAPNTAQVLAGQDYQGQQAAGAANSEDDGLGTNVYVEITELTSQVAYDIFVVGEDAHGNTTSPVTLSATTADQTAPIITPTYLTKVEVTASTSTFSFSMNEAGTFYYVLDPNDGSTPSPAQVMNGQIGSGESAPASGSIVAQADQTYEFQLTDLSDNQEYEVYFVAKDENDNVSEYTYSSYFETPDSTPPVFTSTPEITAVSTMEVSLTANTSEPGTIYTAIIAEDASIPSVADLANQNIDGAIYQGSSSPEYISIIATLELSETYQLVLVAEDENGNLQETVTVLDFTVPDNRSDQVITFELANEANIGDANLPLTAINSSGMDIFYKSSDENVAIIVTTQEGMQVQIIGAGTVEITAYNEGDLVYKPVEVSVLLKVSKLEQSINFTTIGDQTLDNSPITLQATASSGLSVEFALLEGDGVISGNQLTISNTGIFKIEAFQPGNKNYLAAESVVHTFEVHSTMESQTISFDKIANKTYGDKFQLEATASSGLEITYSIVSGPASISNKEVSIIGVGEVIILASQQGNHSYLPAPAVSQTFISSKATLTVEPTDLEIMSGQPIPELVFGYVGFVSDDDASVIDTPPTASTTATASSASGEYAIILSGGTDDQYSFQFEEGTLKIMMVTEVAKDKLNEVHIYPIPFTSSFQIELPNQSLSNFELTIRNLNGTSVYHSILNRNELVYEIHQLSQMPNGIYLVHLTQDDEIQTFKVIKSN